jgi:2-polyprenyl-3-methyl-5-hydroxy-6-metoxy-1,4-benzoquinol methylase
MANDKLTEKQHWDDYWSNVDLPVEIKKSDDTFLLNEELKVFTKYLPKKKLSALEIGGAPGQYLAYMHRQFGYSVSCLDYSEVGCEKTVENFKLLGIPVEVYHKDLFAKNLNMPQFDLVYSMGLIEHFEDVSGVIKKHLDLLKPGGILLLGLPNFRGVNHLFLRWLAPDLLKQHNLKTMDTRTWKSFETELELKTIFKGYVGGFEPMTFMVREKKSLINNLLFLKARVLTKLFHKNFKGLRRFNSRCFSGYILGIYQKPTK